jgi:hypothetical protein
MNYLGNFKKYSYIFVISVAKPKNVVVAFLTLLYGDFGMNSYSIDIYEAIKSYTS